MISINNTINSKMENLLEISLEELEDFLDYLEEKKLDINYQNNELYKESFNNILKSYIKEKSFNIGILNEKNIKLNYVNLISSTNINKKSINLVKRFNNILIEDINKIEDIKYYKENDNLNNNKNMKYSIAKINDDKNKEVDLNNNFKTFLLNIRIDKKNFKEIVFENSKDILIKKYTAMGFDDEDDKIEMEERIEEINNQNLIDHLEDFEKLESCFFDNILLNLDKDFIYLLYGVFYNSISKNLKDIKEHNNKSIYHSSIKSELNILMKNIKRILDSNFHNTTSEIKKIVLDYGSNLLTEEDFSRLKNTKKVLFNFPLGVFPIINRNSSFDKSEELKLIYLNNTEEYYDVKLNFKFNSFRNQFVEKRKYLKERIKIITNRNIDDFFLRSDLFDYSIIYTNKPLSFLSEYFTKLKNNENISNFLEKYDDYNDFYFNLYTNKNNITKNMDWTYDNMMDPYKDRKNIKIKKTFYMNLKRNFSQNKDLIKEVDYEDTDIQLLDNSFQMLDWEIKKEENEVKDVSKYLKENIKVEIEMFSNFEEINVKNEKELNIKQSFDNEKFIKNELFYSDNLYSENNYMLYFIFEILYSNNLKKKINNEKIYIKNNLENLISIKNENNYFYKTYKKILSNINIINNLNNNNSIINKFYNNGNYIKDEHIVEGMEIKNDTILIVLNEFISDTDLNIDNQNNRKYVYGEIFSIIKKKNKVILKKEKEIYEKFQNVNNIFKDLKDKIYELNIKQVVYLSHLNKDQFSVNNIIETENIFSKSFLKKMNKYLDIDIYPFLFNHYFIYKNEKYKTKIEEEVVISNLNKIDDFSNKALFPFFGLFNKYNKTAQDNYFQNMYTFNCLKFNKIDNKDIELLYKLYKNDIFEKTYFHEIKSEIEKIFILYNSTRGKISDLDKVETHFHLYRYMKFLSEDKIKLSKLNSYSFSLIPFGQKLIDISNNKES